MNFKPGVTKSTAQAAGILGIFFGYFGIHDFMTKRYVQGFIHLALALIPAMVVTLIFMIMIPVSFKCGTGDMTGCKTAADLALERSLNDMLTFFGGAVGVCMAASWIWSLVESVMILSSLKNIPATVSAPQQAPQQSAEPQNPVQQ